MLKVKLLRAGAKAPAIAHPGEDLGYDVFAAEDVSFAPRGAPPVPTRIYIYIKITAREPKRPLLRDN
jgi:dUTP pyrophosphatase